MRLRPRHVGLLAVALVAIFAIASCGAIRAGLMLRDALGPAEALASEVVESEHRVDTAGQAIRVRLYEPAAEREPRPGIVLVHGAVDAGAADRRLVSLARAMAVRGSVVAAPQLAALARFRLDPRDPQRLAAVGAWLASQSDRIRDARVAFVGISVGGSYALIAATDARLAQRVSTVLAFGAYADLDRLIERWLTEPGEGAPGLHDPRTTGRRLVLLGNLAALVPPPDRAATREVLRALLERRQPPPEPRHLGAEARLVIEVARSEDPVAEAVADRLLAPLRAAMRALSPVRLTRAPQVPIHLLHGTGDPIVPASALENLAASLEALGAEVSSFETDLFTHVGTRDGGEVSFFEAWPLLGFIADAMDDAGF